MRSILIQNIKSLLQTCDTSPKIIRGKEMGVIPQIENAFLLIENKKIKAFGSMENTPTNADEIIDASGKFVLPAFCDSHTHLVFAAKRQEEFVMRIQGKSYEEIASAGGGILNSAKKLLQMSEAELYDLALDRIETLKKTGTGAVEIKSGYGLSFDGEIKMLRVIRKLKETSDVQIKSTFLGAHAVPHEYILNRSAYIKLLIEKMIPFIAAEKLADYCDVFCEQNYFSHSETDLILEAAAKYGLKPKIHVNQFTNNGGVQTGIKNHALTVDHLEEIGEEEINALLQSNTIPVVLPSCSFFIKIPYAPARKMIDAGLPIAIASDFNPGSSPSGNMPFALTLACIYMQLIPEEAIQACTINGAAAMELDEKLGTITHGKMANVIITKKMHSIAELPYSFGENLIDRLIL